MTGSLRRFWTMWHRCLPGDTIETSIESELKHSTDANELVRHAVHWEKTGKHPNGAPPR